MNRLGGPPFGRCPLTLPITVDTRNELTLRDRPAHHHPRSKPWYHNLPDSSRGAFSWPIRDLPDRAGSARRGTSRPPAAIQAGGSRGMVQTQVTAQGWLGSTPAGRRPQIRGWRAGGSLAVDSSTPATPLLSPAKIRELNHAAERALLRPQALCIMNFRAVGFLDLLRLTGRSVRQTVTADACVHGSRRSGQRRGF